MVEQKFAMYQPVYFEGTKWYVSGFKVRVGYDVLLPSYCITQGMYGDVGPERWGGRSDHCEKENIREEQLMSEREFLELKQVNLQKEKAELEKRLAELNSELE